MDNEQTTYKLQNQILIQSNYGTAQFANKTSKPEKMQT